MQDVLNISRLKLYHRLFKIRHNIKFVTNNSVFTTTMHVQLQVIAVSLSLCHLVTICSLSPFFRDRKSNNNITFEVDTTFNSDWSLGMSRSSPYGFLSDAFNIWQFLLLTTGHTI